MTLRRTLVCIPGLARAALSYYAQFSSEVDADAEWAARIESVERSRWEREQGALLTNNVADFAPRNWAGIVPESGTIPAQIVDWDESRPDWGSVGDYSQLPSSHQI